MSLKTVKILQLTERRSFAVFEKVAPETVGISSKCIMKYLKKLEDAELSVHDVIILRHKKICFEGYWEPFSQNYLHRIYSAGKSFIALAVGFLIEDGKISLDDRIIDLLPEEITKDANEMVKLQTVRDMLTMETGHPYCDGGWMARRTEDRLRDYFEHSEAQGIYPGTIFRYDSQGSFVLSAIVEILTGKSFIEYLRGKLFDKIGVSKEAYCLKCPGGYEWTDSGILCTARDLMKVAVFVMNGGNWCGEQLLSKRFIEEATSFQVSTDETGNRNTHSYGYGYYFWRGQQNSYFFSGMGSQYAICIPDKDMIFVFNGDGQGNPLAHTKIIDGFFDTIIDNVENEYLPRDTKAEQKLDEYAKNLKLWYLHNSQKTDFQNLINGKEFLMEQNPMKITKLRLDFFNNGGKLSYENVQGYKEIPFGIGENVFSDFPEEGYSDLIGSKPELGNRYKCAVSAAWIEEKKIILNVQIIDKYFGKLHIVISFSDENHISVFMKKAAQDFLFEYEGYAVGKIDI